MLVPVSATTLTLKIIMKVHSQLPGCASRCNISVPSLSSKTKKLPMILLWKGTSVPAAHFRKGGKCPHSAAFLLTPASLTLSTAPYELTLEACALHQQTIFLSSRASNLLSFVAKERHCLYTPCHGTLTSASLSAHLFTGWEYAITSHCTRRTATRFTWRQ